VSNLIDQINFEIEKQSLLKHDFYQLWQEGKLTLDHLAGYSKEYFQMVKIVPSLVKNVMESNVENKYQALIQNTLEDELTHIEPWINFSTSLNVDRNELLNYNPDGLTKQSIDNMLKISKASFEESVAALYALEKELPKISETKLEGLKKFYGITNDESNEYFNIHKEIDIYHSKVWETILNETSFEMKDKILNSVKVSLEAQNMLLDSVKSKYVDQSVSDH
jgi:pyrroloquinoline-quinone synthase